MVTNPILSYTGEKVSRVCSFSKDVKPPTGSPLAQLNSGFCSNIIPFLAMGCGASTGKYAELAYEKFKHDAEDEDLGVLGVVLEG